MGNKLWDKFEDKPQSTVMPVKVEEERLMYSDLEKQIIQLYKDNNLEHYYQYKKGTMLTSSSEEYTVFLSQFIKLVIQCVREETNNMESEEQRQLTLIQISALETAMCNLAEVLRTLNFKLDINSVVAIIHGYVNENVKHIFANYETRRRIKN